MDRMACISLPVFPVQLLLRRHPDWHNRPVAVVDDDKPQGTVLWRNEHARALRVRPGMRYAAALSLARDLRAAVVPGHEVDTAVARIGELLGAHSPRIEPAAAEAGVFWLDASGLQRLYGSLDNWAQQVRTDLQGLGLESTVVLGFRRFATYALAKSQTGILILNDPEDEQTAALRVTLDWLTFEPKTKDLLRKLGIRTVGQFIALPPAGIDRRCGPQAVQLYRLARGKCDLPLTPLRPPTPLSRCLVLDYPEVDVHRLTAAIAPLLESILHTSSRQGRLLNELKIRFLFDRIGSHTERLRPAAPTRDSRLLLELIRLRLDAAGRLPDGVVEINLNADCVAESHKQNHLLEVRPKRDLAPANRALARVRAELGDEAVVHAHLREAHLPEGQFTWEPLHILGPAKPRVTPAGCLIRRMESRPQIIAGWTPPKASSAMDMKPDLRRGGVARSSGPYMVSGGWWRRSVQRAYYFAETRAGEILWVYFDHVRRRWFRQGRVE